MQSATTAMFFEARKKKDLYIWLSKVPCGPCVRFYCTNIHTMAELKLSGNHLKGSRPVVTFDAAFDEQPHLQARTHYCAVFLFKHTNHRIVSSFSGKIATASTNL